MLAVSFLNEVELLVCNGRKLMIMDKIRPSLWQKSML